MAHIQEALGEGKETTADDQVAAVGSAPRLPAALLLGGPRVSLVRF